jgi:hypothetical protein
MSTKILPPMVAAILVGTTIVASAQTSNYWQDPYANLRDVVPGPSYNQGPFTGTFSQGLPYGGTYGYFPGPYNYGNFGPPLGYEPNR